MQKLILTRPIHSDSAQDQTVQRSNNMRTFTHGLVITSVLLLSGLAQAEGTQSAKARYQADRAACLQAGQDQDRAACLKEAGAALQQSRKTGSVSSSAPHDEQNLMKNRTLRCQALPVPDREDCVRRIQGEGTVEGSVETGGILRTLERPVTPGSTQ